MTGTGTHDGQHDPRYGGVAMALHWATAAAIFLMLASGLTMTRMAPGMTAFNLYQWHKALGITVLALTLIRLVWRLGHRPPPLPDAMPTLEKLGARLAHLGFYALLLGLPLSGWLLVSVSPLNLPTSWFGYFLIPHLPAPTDAALRQTLNSLSETAHGLGGWTLLALLFVHIAAALRHALILHDHVLRSMLPRWLAPRKG
ncbi:MULTISPECIES: cytochrome b [unclassified Azospirillum]|uniref:cytochrome b n=1 Tax=unclassified Azospirillum TaxID=2630922 RepID=UPI000B744FE7|nr:MULTISPECIES: cytochrome b [unclassified Azospirillum]SNS57546.1 cytochrome b561 [Azospirillum sp. RU38E]SNS77382.1 cytochrome b561 [Azospirillum sp. RU37A]